MPSLKHGLAIVGVSIAAGITGCHGSCCHQQEVCCDECDNGAYYAAPNNAYPSYSTPVMPSQPVLQPAPTHSTPPPAPSLSPGSVPPSPNLPSASNYPTTAGQPGWFTNGGASFNESAPQSVDEQPSVFQKVRHSMKRAFTKVTGQGHEQVEYVEFGQLQAQPATEPLPNPAGQHMVNSPQSIPQSQSPRELHVPSGRSNLLSPPGYSSTPYPRNGF